MGKEVRYGEKICLMHEESGLFLSADSRCTIFDKSAFGCELTDKLSKRVIFRVDPN